MFDTTDRTALVVGASRTLGLAITAELLRRGWHVISTVRGGHRTGLHDLAETSDRLEIESVDITAPDQVDALRARLEGRTLDLLFVNAGIAHANVPVTEVSTESFTEVMITNALSPVRVVERLRPLVAENGTIGVMSSRQGSLTLNTNGGHEVYRASKSALNQLMRSYAARHADDRRAVLLINPGWVRTELGGPGAVLTVEQSAPGVVDVLERHHGEPGLRFLDHEDNALPW
ncbi:SDR family NAD(P)-dependent oxidoreductase [Lentzea sp. NPDC058450]|uniref:SDR family NAD(P)-dependent oxidoreductase n=1 Tax=Lentzea sp. NPDC058450 TaxID=3346505 RepID=UPI00364D61DB